MTNYKEYLEFDNGEYKEKQEKVIDKIKFTKENEEKIKKIGNKNLEILAQPYCPDCRVLVAILENMVIMNKNIAIKYMEREENSDYRIPTIFLDKEIIFVEFPKKIKEILEKSLDKDETIYLYRTGKYNKEVIEELIEILS